MRTIPGVEESGMGRTQLSFRLFAALLAIAMIATAAGGVFLVLLQQHIDAFKAGALGLGDAVWQREQLLIIGLACTFALVVLVLAWSWFATYRAERDWRHKQLRLAAAFHEFASEVEGRAAARTSELAEANATLREETQALMREVARRKAAEAEARRQSRNRALTGLVDRSTFLDAIEQALARSQGGDQGFAVFVLALDDANKVVNAAAGQTADGAQLPEVARRLQATLRTTDLLAILDPNRIGVVAAGIDDPGNAVIMADTLIATAGGSRSTGGDETETGVNVGIALSDSAVADGEAVLANAEVALKQAMSSARDAYCFFTETMSVGARDRVALIGELREAIASSKQFFLLYQPQVEIGSGKIVGLEALLRWDHPLRGVLSPARFVPIAESAGLMAALDRWAWREASLQSKAWLDAGLPAVVTSVNVTAAYVARARQLGEDVAAVLATSGLPPSHFEIEVSEHVLMQATEAQMDALAQLRPKGIRLAIDDLGAGSSSFRHLRQYAADRVTIAQELVRTIDFDPVSAAMVRSTIGLCRDLGIVTSAKGVSTAAQLEMLRSWGCREAQGFLFAKPLAADDAASLLSHGVIDISERIAATAAA